MLLDNLFEMMGGVGTTLLLCGILMMVGTPAVTTIACRRGLLRGLQRGL